MQTRGAEAFPPTPSTVGAPNFAGILASVADPPWNDDGLADDVATISYEQALRTHARSRIGISEKMADPDPPQESPESAPRKLKTASITIRLSEPECAQVRRRAAEAGLTVSAYLRSCVLEAESLRAQVKETVAQLRGSPAMIEPAVIANHAQPDRIPNRVWHWLTRRAAG